MPTSPDQDIARMASAAGPPVADQSDTPVDLLARIAEMATLRAEHPAVEAPDGRLTYAELDRVSSRLARHLRGLGVARESRVGISLPRGAGELVAMLATLKAGGAYLPLDPHHPTERLRNIIEDATPEVLIAGADSPVTTLHRGKLVVLDRLAWETQEPLADSWPEPVEAGQLMYVLFTSGSTGRPKGVEITRGAFANFLSSMAHTPGMGPDDRLLAITTTSFDIAGLELFLPLYVGATVVIVERTIARDPYRLRQRLEQGDISIMQATPASWRLLLEAGYCGNGKLRILCGGEALSSALADRLLDAAGELWNLYGPTETTVWSSLARIERKGERVTIGRPIDRTTMCVLDESGRSLANGEEGEIAIGGAGLARGYLGRPDLTAQRFVVLPSGERVYRTGDLGRMRSNGTFECLGRLDHQVKISGFRIELGEIEAVLRSVPDVHEVLVVVDGQDQRTPRLVAYFTGLAPPSALLAAARGRLPDYMVPSAFVPLDVFPLNTNGKIDRKQLPRPMPGRIAGQKPPRNDLEERIAAVWRETLGLARLGVDGDFFALGGTSGHAIEAVARLRRELRVDVPVQLLYEAPTVEKLALRLHQSFSPDDPIVIELRKGSPNQPPLFCLLGVNQYQDLALALAWDRSVIAVHVPARYRPDREAPPTIEEVARRYVAQIRKQQPHGPYYLLGLCFGGIVAYEAAYQLQAAGEKVPFVTVLDAILPAAFQANRISQARHYASRAAQDPRRVLSWARKVAGRAGRLVRGRDGPETDGAEPVDLPIDGPTADLLVARFAAEAKHLHSQLLIVHASSEESHPPWITIRSDLGWAGRADRVIEHVIAASHLRILREPHVRGLAAVLEREMG